MINELFREMLLHLSYLLLNKAALDALLHLIRLPLLFLRGLNLFYHYLGTVLVVDVTAKRIERGSLCKHCGLLLLFTARLLFHFKLLN
jgi:hypothetical protein